MNNRKLHEHKAALLPSERPKTVLDAINRQAKILKDTIPNYAYEGKDAVRSINMFGMRLSSAAIFEKLFKKAPGNDAKYLGADLGTGAGELPCKINKDFPHIFVRGYTATDYHAKNAAIHVANLEYFFKCPHIKENTFDIITAFYFFGHLVDPARALVDAYAALKVGGVMVANCIFFHGLQGRYQQVCDFWQDKGYKIVTVVGYDEKNPVELINFLAIRKTNDHPTLDIPVVYSGKITSSGKAHYDCTLPVREFDDTQRSVLLKVHHDLEKFIKDRKDSLYAKDLREFVEKISAELVELARHELQKGDVLDIYREVLARKNYRFLDYVSKCIDEVRSSLTRLPTNQFLNLILVLAAEELRFRKTVQRICNDFFPLTEATDSEPGKLSFADALSEQRVVVPTPIVSAAPSVLFQSVAPASQPKTAETVCCGCFG